MAERNYKVKPVSNGFIIENDGRGVEVVQGNVSNLEEYIARKSTYLVSDEVVIGSKDEFVVTIKLEKC